MELAKKCAITGEPIVTNLEYYFPNKGYHSVNDEFMLGPDILVAPMTEKGNVRKVVLPEGNWKGDNENMYIGDRLFSINVPHDRLPVFRRTT